MSAIFKREMRAYFTSPIGFIFIAIFFVANGALFSYLTLQAGSTSDISSYFLMLLFLFIILIPLLTMKLFCEERKQKTEQLLMTAPITLPGMVLGKFFAAFTLFVSSVIVSCINFFPLYPYANAEGLNDAYASAVGPVGISIFCCTIGIISAMQAIHRCIHTFTKLFSILQHLSAFFKNLVFTS